jgi:hypothetical protein
LETTVVKKLVPVLGLLLLAGPVFAADAPASTSAPAASADSAKAAPKSSTHKHHKKKAAKPADASAAAK